MQGYKIIELIRNHKLLIGVLLAGLAVLAIASRYSFISIEVPAGGNSGRYTYRLLNQSSQKITEVKTGSSSIKKLVVRGDYEVLVSSDSGSSFEVARAGGFLGTTQVKAELAPERSRTFVGDNPELCMHYADMLYSFSCQGSLETLAKHVPATTAQPTYTSNNTVAAESTIEGTVKTEEGSFALASSFGVENEGSTHAYYPLRSGIRAGTSKPLTGLDSDKLYSTKDFQDGFLAYSDQFDHLVYYSSLSAASMPISLGRPAEGSMAPHLLDARGSTVIAIYSNNTTGETANLEEPAGDVANEVFVSSAGSEKSFSLNGAQYSAARLCGSNRLCLLAGDQALVYNIAGPEPKLEFKVTQVKSLEMSQNRLLLVRQGEVLSLDVASKSGRIDYSLSGYEYCGVQDNGDSYLLCVINSREKKAALSIDSSSPDQGGVDKKVNQLLELSEILDASIYKNLIFISPELGELKFIAASGGFGYDPETKARVNARINQEVQRLGIDTSKYRIINALD